MGFLRLTKIMLPPAPPERASFGLRCQHVFLSKIGEEVGWLKACEQKAKGQGTILDCRGSCSQQKPGLSQMLYIIPDFKLPSALVWTSNQNHVDPILINPSFEGGVPLQK